MIELDHAEVSKLAGRSVPDFTPTWPNGRRAVGAAKFEGHYTEGLASYSNVVLS
jgi:hypothetical protein